MNEKMSLNEIKWNEDVLEARKLKKEKERWKEEDEWKRIIRIFNICEKLKKPHDLNLTCPRCDREGLRIEKFKKWMGIKYEDLFEFTCGVCGYNHRVIDIHYPDMYCEPLH